MTKIKNTKAYPFKIPVINDFVTGTDSETENKDTVSFSFEDIARFVNSFNGNENINYIYANSLIGELDENGNGYFLSENNETDPSLLSKIIVSKKTKTNFDLSELFNFIKNNNDSFILKLQNTSDPNNFIYFEITSITEELYQFTINVSIYNSDFFSGILEENNVYGFFFDLKSQGSGDNYSQIVYVNSPSPTTATIFDTNNPPLTNDNSLKNKVENLYIGNDASTWVYITSPAGYVTKVISNITSNFYLSGTTIDAGTSKSAPIERTGTVGGAPGTAPNHFITKSQLVTELSYACSDEVSDLVVGTLITFRMPIGLILTNVKLSLNIASTVSKVIVDIRKNGLSIFSTLISVDVGQTTSVGASVPAVISDSNLTDDSIITITTTQVGSGTAGKGLKVTFIGNKV